MTIINGGNQHGQSSSTIRIETDGSTGTEMNLGDQYDQSTRDLHVIDKSRGKSPEAARQAVAAKSTPSATERSPWFSGSFYLVAFLLTLVTVALISNSAPLWALPLGAVTALIAVAVVGALELRRSGHLSETNFLKLMAKAIAQLPNLLKGKVK